MSAERHPILRNASFIISALLAASMVVLSAFISSHTIPWIVGFFLASSSLLVSLRRNPATPLARAYAFYLATLSCYLFAVWILHAAVPGPDPEEIKSLFTRILPLFYPAVITMAVAHLRFTRMLSRSKSALPLVLEVAGWAGCVFFLAQCVMGIFIIDFHWMQYTWVPTLEGGYGPFFYFTTVYLLLSFLVPTFALFREKDAKNRLQLIYYLIGAVPLFVSCWINFLISMGFRLYPIGGFAFLFHAAVLTYAITFEQLFDLRFSLRRGLAYALVSVLLGVVYGALMWAVPHMGLLDASRSILTGTLLAVFAGFFFAPALSYVQQLVDRAFFRLDTDQQAQLENFARQSSATADAASIARLLCDTVSGLASPRRIDLHLLTREESFRLFASYTDSLLLSKWPLSAPLAEDIHVLMANATGARHINLHSELPHKGVIQLSVSNEGLVVPLRHNERTLGCLLLYPRLADEPYSDDIRRLLETLAASAATAFENSRTTGQLDFLRSLTRQTFDHLAAGILIVNEAGLIMQHNPAARTLLETPGEPLPRTLEELRARHPALVETLNTAVTHRTIHKNAELQIDGPPQRTVLFSSEELGQQDGQAIFLLLLNDITAYKELENAGRRKEALARVGGMIASINHEIKNILQPTRYQIEKLRNISVDDPVFTHAMRVIHDRMASLDRLMLNLKDLSRPIELRRRAISSLSLLESSWEDVKSLPAASKVQCSIDVQAGAETFHGDGQWLRQVFVNLMKNAVEAMEAKDAPELRVEARDESDAISIRVSDNGSGISSDTLTRLFEPFHSTKAEAGTGLGLSISRRIVELHGGSVDVESKVDKGTTFVVRLPRDKATVKSEAA